MIELNIYYFSGKKRKFKNINILQSCDLSCVFHIFMFLYNYRRVFINIIKKKSTLELKYLYIFF
jgi:hypothetical protein